MKKKDMISILHIASGDLWAGAEAQLYTLAKTLVKRQDVTLNIILLNHGLLEQKLLSAKVNVIILDEAKLNGLQILKKSSTILAALNLM